jgi:hypothetical protein
MAKQTTVKPGQDVPRSGQYIVKGSSGKKEVTLVKDKPAPPTPKKGQEFKLVDPTKHKK